MDEGQRRSIGRVVQVLREAAGLSRAELAARTSDAPAQRLGREMVAKVEQGRKAPSPASAAKIARALGLATAELARSAARWEAGAAMGVREAALRQELLGVVRPEPPPAAGTQTTGTQTTGTPTTGTRTLDLDAAEPGGRRADLVRRLERSLRELTARGTTEQLESAVLALQAHRDAAPVRLASIDIGVGIGAG